MNENARALYEDLKASRLPQFDMSVVQECGTPHCILGHAIARIGKLPHFQRYRNTHNRAVSDWPISRAAFKFLGLDVDVAKRLCFPHGDGPWEGVNDPFAATQPEAAEALKRACELSALTPAIQRGGE